MVKKSSIPGVIPSKEGRKKNAGFTLAAINRAIAIRHGGRFMTLGLLLINPWLVYTYPSEKYEFVSWDYFSHMEK